MSFERVLTVDEWLRLKKDAERYRWLRAGNAYRPEEWSCTGGDELDQFIDESIEEKRTSCEP